MKEVIQMKKNRKPARKPNQCNGTNVHGEPCIAKFVKLKKETALDQYLEIISDLERPHKYPVEYTVDSSCFTPEEAMAFDKLMTHVLEFRTNRRGVPLILGEFHSAA